VNALRPRAVLESLRPYPAERTPVDLDLADNVNLWGMPPAAIRALADPGALRPSAYPPVDPIELRAALADYAGVRPEQVITGCGSDDVIDGALRAFAAPGDRVACCSPTFSMLTHFARVNDLVPVQVPFLPDGGLNVGGLLAAGAEITYVCAPNNPTGAAVSAGALAELLSSARGLVLVDEAYGEFSGASAVPWLQGTRHLLVTRTLSKAFGMAGLRVGYGLAAPEVVRVLELVRGPYRVNTLALRAAVAALREDLGWVRRHVLLAVESRERLVPALRRLGLAPLPSAANFVCIPVPDPARVGAALLERGIRVRVLPGVAGGAIRVGVGPWEAMERLLAALGEALR
jgi:histidinol-phosphate aminotransferase